VGQQPEQIEQHIHQTRARLEENVAELRTRVRSNLDWRYQFQRHPVTLTAGAFLGGLLLAMAAGRAMTSARLRRRALEGTLLGGLSGGQARRLGARRASWDQIVDTLIELGPTQVRGLFGELLPALREYLARR